MRLDSNAHSKFASEKWFKSGIVKVFEMGIKDMVIRFIING